MCLILCTCRDAGSCCSHDHVRVTCSLALCRAYSCPTRHPDSYQSGVATLNLMPLSRCNSTRYEHPRHPPQADAALLHGQDQTEQQRLEAVWTCIAHIACGGHPSPERMEAASPFLEDLGEVPLIPLTQGRVLPVSHRFCVFVPPLQAVASRSSKEVSRVTAWGA